MLVKQRFLKILFFISATSFLTFSSVIYYQSRIVDEYNKKVIETYETIDTLRQLLRTSLDLETGQRGYLLTQDKSFLDPYNKAKNMLVSRIQEVQQDIKSRKWDEEYFTLHIEKPILDHRELIDNQIQEFQNTGIQSINQEDMMRAKVGMDVIRNNIKIYVEKQLEKLNTDIELRRENADEYLWMLLFGTVFSIGIVLVSALILQKMDADHIRLVNDKKLLEDTHRLLLESIQDGIYDYNPITKTVIFSESYQRMLGYTFPWDKPSDITTFNSLIHPEDAEGTWEAINKFLNQKTLYFQHTFRLQHKDGTWRWLLSRGFGLKDPQNRIIRMVGLNTDITDQKNQEQTLRDINNELQGFTYIASHDLRSPLVNMKGFAGELEYSIDALKPVIEGIEPHLSDEQRTILQETFYNDIPEAVRFIKSAVDRMDRLTNAIVKLSYIGKQTYKKEPVDFNEMVQRCLESLSHDIKEKSAIVSVPDPLPVVITDLTAVEQVFANILENAVKFLDDNREGHITVTAKKSSYDVVFCIADNGRGIGQEDFDKVFNIFRRASNTGGIRGSGMGMAFVRATVRKLGGKIWFDSTLDKGTTFYISLPVYFKKGEGHEAVN